MSLQQFTGCGRRGQRVSKIYSISDDDKYIRGGKKETKKKNKECWGEVCCVCREQFRYFKEQSVKALLKKDL